MILPAIIGIAIIANVLWEAFETVILPRRVTRRFRLAVLYYRTTWYAWRTHARFIRKTARRESFLGIFGPLSLLMLFVLWAAGLIFGFGLLYYSAAVHAGIPATLTTSCY